jgi:tetratricopeptide (TPR) repeat protein
VRLLPYLLLLGLPVLPVVQRRVDRRLGIFRAQHEVLYLWSGEHIRRLTPGFENLMADIYWLRTVQYFGGERVFSTEKRFDLLVPLINITIALDPRLEIAYRYGATFLAEPWPAGAGNPDAAIALLRRGLARNPANWRLRQDLGLLYFVFKDDPVRASQVLLEGASIPGAPAFLRTLAAQVLVKGGERQSAKMLWQQIYDESEPGQLKGNAALHLGQLQSLDALDALNAAAAGFARRAGRPPATLDELRRSGLTAVPTVDAAGTPFEYNSSTGKAFFSPQSPLWRRELEKYAP